MQKLDQFIGDTFRLGIPLKWQGRPFEPGVTWNLIFSLKADIDADEDADALVQKETGVGITHSGTDALVDFVPQDTAGDPEEDPVIPAIAPGTYYWGVLAVHNSTGARRNVASGSLALEQSPTRLSEPSVPIYTTNPPSPNSVVGQINDATAKTTPVDADRFALTDSAASYVLKKVTWANIKATLKAYFDTLYDAAGAAAAVLSTSAQKDSNLSDLASASTARTNLGLGTAATTDASAYATAAQGTTADGALQRSGGTMTGNIAIGGNNLNASSGGSTATQSSTGFSVVSGGATSRLRQEGLYHQSATLSTFELNYPTLSGPGRTQAFQDKDGTIAYTDDPAMTDERVPTSAGLTTKFGTNKATLVDADKIAILDSAASDAPKHGLVSALISLIIGTGRTLAGAWAFSSTTRPTSSATGLPEATSLVTRDDTHRESLFNIGKIRNYGTASYSSTGGYVGPSGAYGDVIVIGATVGEKGCVAAYRLIGDNDNWTGAANRVSTPFSVATLLSPVLPSATNEGVIRNVIGMNTASGGIAAGSNPLTGLGIGYEIFWSTANSRAEIRLFSHDGSTYQTSAGVDVTAANASYLVTVLEHLANGTLNLYISTGIASRPSSTPVLTLTGCPTSGAFANSGILAYQCANNPTSVSGGMGLFVVSREMLLL